MTIHFDSLDDFVNFIKFIYPEKAINEEELRKKLETETDLLETDLEKEKKNG